MTVFVLDPDLTIHLGDVRDVLPTLEAESVDCVATSPPFYALRDYGTGQWEGGNPDCDHAVRPTVKTASSTLGGGKATSGHQREGYRSECKRCGALRVDRQIGLEASPEEWCDELVSVFRECRRVLKPSGTLWIECGDSYCANQGAVNEGGDRTATKRDGTWRTAAWAGGTHTPMKHPTKPKDLLGQPWLLAFALRADGWWLRQAIIWHKPNAMPESATDRCTTAHSYVFLLSKSPRYWFDADAIAEPAAWERWGDQTVPKHEGTETAAGWMQPKTKAELYEDLKERRRNGEGEGEYESGGLVSGRRFASATGGLVRPDGMKNARSVWTIPTRGYPGAHFATWPMALAERIIAAGCPEWVCGTCGKPRERIVEKGDLVATDPRGKFAYQSTAPDDGFTRAGATASSHRPGMRYENTMVGWSDCGHGNYTAGTVLDPFGGAGTTGLVARKHGRKAVLIELNEDYCRLAAERCSQLSLLAEPA